MNRALIYRVLLEGITRKRGLTRPILGAARIIMFRWEGGGGDRKQTRKCTNAFPCARTRWDAAVYIGCTMSTMPLHSTAVKLESLNTNFFLSC